MTDLSVSIVNYNSREDLIRCLDSLKENAPRLTHDVWVIDNASSEPIGDLQPAYGRVNFIFNDKNIGFGAANNLAIRQADSRYHLILNPDLRVGKGMIDSMAAFMEENADVGIAGPKLVNEDGTLQYSCRRFPTVASFILRGLFPDKRSKVMADYFMLDEDHSQIMDVDWVLGSCMLARKKLLDELHGFDERYFMYYEDIDLCYRVKRAGSRVAYYPLAEAAHTYKRDSAKGGVSGLKLAHTAGAARFFLTYLGQRRWRTFR